MLNNIVENIIREFKNNKDLDTYVTKHIELLTENIVEKSSIKHVGTIIIIIFLIQLIINIYILYLIKNK